MAYCFDSTAMYYIVLIMLVIVFCQGEMEDRREEGQADYWLVQYQRLMDRKPQVLIDRVRR